MKIIHQLKPGDHICRDFALNATITTNLIQHHGVVYSVPLTNSSLSKRLSEEEILEKAMVFQMIANGIEKVKLRRFMKGIDIKIVKYKANEKLPLNKIKMNIDTLHSQCKNGKNLYNLMINNCEQAAIFVVTGKSDHDFDDQVTNAMQIATTATKETVVQAVGAIVKAATKNSSVVTSTADDAIMWSASTVSTKIMAGVGAGVAVAIQGGVQVWRHKKYKNDASYSKYDYAMDSAEGWTGVAATTAVGTTLAVGGATFWWVLLPTLGVSGLCWGAWKLGKYLFGKSEKEKWYWQHKINSKDRQSLENGKERIKNLILEEYLNPDLIDKNMFNDKEKQYKCTKFLMLTQMIENIEIDLAFFDYYNNDNNIKTIKNAKKGISNLKKLIHKNKLHPDLYGTLETSESEKQRRRAKYDSFMSKIEQTENEILEMQNSCNDYKYHDRDSVWNCL